MKDSITALRALQKQLYAYRYAEALISYDEAAVAPPESEAGRAEASEVFARLSFDALVNPGTAALLAQAGQDAEDAQQAAEVRELRRAYDRICRIPAEEYAAFSKLVAQAMPAWGRAKRGNDFAAFAPYLEQIVAAKRRQAACIDPARDPYEVWLDQYEPGLTVARCDAFFAALRTAIVPLLAEIQKRGAPIRTDFITQDWPLAQQKELSRRAMALWGLDPAHTVLGESEHPFTDSLYSGDVRMTTHYHPTDATVSLYSVLHEGGHALYDAHVDPALDYTVLQGGASMSIHESQSRLFENCVGRSRAFVHCLWPTLKELFPAQLADVTEEEWYRAVNRAEPGPIRTEADELTYPLHIMVRYELEKALLHGELAVRDLPAAWNAKYQQTLGLTPPDDAHGVLQDMHWAGGDIGYFPSYALGSAYAAQAMDDIRKTLDVDACVARGDLAPLRAELEKRLWRYGCLKTPDELIGSLCGGAFDPQHYIGYLTRKYTALYAL